MKIIGNKICLICMELNNNRRKYCSKCGNALFGCQITDGFGYPNTYNTIRFFEFHTKIEFTNRKELEDEKPLEKVSSKTKR